MKSYKKMYNNMHKNMCINCAFGVKDMLEKTLSEARKDLSRLVADCAVNGGTVITVHGKPAAYLLSAEEYQALKKTALEKEMQPIFSEFDSLFKALTNK